MIHLLPTTLLFLAAAPLSVQAAESARKWTTGRSICESSTRQALENPALVSVESQPLEQAWDFAQQDMEALSVLTCFPDAARVAGEVSVQLRTLEEGVLPGVKATACEQAARPGDARLASVKESLARMQGSEGFLQNTLDRYDQIQRLVNAGIPPGGVAFDDCRAKAQRGWARARASLNRLSCTISASIDRLDSFRDRAEQSGLASLECAATGALAQAPASIAAGTVMVVAPVTEAKGYQPFTGVDPAPMIGKPAP